MTAGRIDIVSASAGSGKTYRLARALEDAVVRDGVRPESVLAVTFTNKAAAELRERVRTGLLRAGMVREAERLGAAFLGTVHAVCRRLVTESAFELGLSPDIEVLDEDRAREELSVSLDAMIREREEELSALGERLGVEDWTEPVRRVADLARSNGVSAGGLAESARRSAEGLLALLGDPGDGPEIDAALPRTLRAFLAAAKASDDATKATAKARESVEKALRKLDRGLPLPWRDWLELSRLEPGKALREAAGDVRAAAARQDGHPLLREDLAAAVRVVFDLAAGALERYAARKRDLGAMDFTDQETMARELLSLPEAPERLQGRIGIVLVDEFQDTSPLQLALFLRLARIAPRSLWVGDPKQAVYGFRGTDPALMEAAIEEILHGEEPETLSRSYRSRPALVSLTSDLFAPAFARQGIRAARVRLTPAAAEEPAGLGPAVERWVLPSKRQEDDLRALAAGVKDLLDRRPSVRDPASGAARPLSAGDVAVLCRTNKECAGTAAALAELGVEAVLPRGGLLATPQAWLVLAGLRLWVDAGDTLAAAEIARLTAYAGRGDAWFREALSGPGAFGGLPEAAAIRRAAEARPRAGALAAFDEVAGILEAGTLCLRWGSAEARTADLEALRAHAVRYADSCRASGSGCTPAGLVAHLRSLSGEEGTRGVPAGAAAVSVSTLHGAKGLEWPVAVLYDPARRERFGPALGVHAEAGPALGMEDPLAGRWIRFWPYPYGGLQTGAPLHARLADRPETQAASERGEREELRLLYVGWTRARDLLVIASRGGKLLDGMLRLLQGPQGPLLCEPQGGKASWAGREREVPVREPEPREGAAAVAVPGEGYAAAGPKDHPPAFLAPSGAPSPEEPGEGRASEPILERIGEGIPVSGTPDWACLGNALHGFLAADDPGLPEEERLAMADRLLAAWGVRGAVDPGRMLRAAAALRAWTGSRWPSAERHAEWPLLLRLPEGTVMRGTCDLALETPEGCVLIDHKSFPGTEREAARRAAAYGGQIAQYADAIRAATGRPVAACYVHLPVSGLVARLP